MRYTHLLSAALVLGCTRGGPPASPPAPQPEPPPSPPPAQEVPGRIIPRAINGHPRMCVVRNGQLESVEVEFNPARGDSAYQGRLISEAFPIDSTYALNTQWYRDNEPITVRGRRYVKYGLPRILGTTDVMAAGKVGAVTVFAESPDRPVLEVVYIPVRPGCEFQPYTGSGIK